MRIIIVFSVIVTSFFFSSRVCAQSNPVPDSSFEVWSTGQPAGWTVNPDLIFQSSDAHSGLWAAGGRVVNGVDSAPFIQTSFPIAYRPDAFEGYYKLSSTGGDEIMMFCALICSGSPVAQAIFVDSSSTTEYKHFSIPIIYSEEQMPDGVLILVEMQNSNSVLHPGSNFVVDDIALSRAVFDPLVSVDPGPKPFQFSLVQNYPNPFSQSTQISFTSAGAYAEVSVVNLLGMEVAQIFSGELAAGNHIFTWNAGENEPGMYECVVRINGQIQRIPLAHLQ